MMCYTVIATLCLFGIAAAQTSLDVTSCITKEQNLRMFCKFTPAQQVNDKLKVCYFQSEGKMVASSNATAIIDAKFKERAKLAFQQNLCQLNLTGLDSTIQKYTCFIKQTESNAANFTATVEKSKLSTCSAWCTLQHSAVMFLMIFITSPLMLELL